MAKHFPHMDFISEIFPLNRTIVHDDMKTALKIVEKYLPSCVEMDVREFKSGQKCWTWEIPPKYEIVKGILKNDSGEVVVDVAENHLHVVSYSQSFKGWLDFSDLEPHLYYSEKRPNAIPWKFSYYERDWGFCLPYNQFIKLDRNAKYFIDIGTKFTDGELLVGEVYFPGSSANELLVIADICHPLQVNDSITGVSAAIDLVHRISRVHDRRISVRFLFLPETIGSIAYLSQNESKIKNIKYGLFSEMLGHDNTLALQHSLQGNSEIDNFAIYTAKTSGIKIRTGEFGKIIRNDEKVVNGPGIKIPTISISRAQNANCPYDQYHTSDDNLSIVSTENIVVATDWIEKIWKHLDSNYFPCRKFKGPIFLSGYGLWNVWEKFGLKRQVVDRLMYLLDGDFSVLQISKTLGIPFEKTLALLDVFVERNLVDKNQDKK